MLNKIKFLYFRVKLFLYSPYLINISFLATLFFFQSSEDINNLLREIHDIYPNAEITSITIVAKDPTNSYGLVDIVYRKNNAKNLDEETQNFIEHNEALLKHLQDRGTAANIIKRNEK